MKCIHGFPLKRIAMRNKLTVSFVDVASLSDDELIRGIRSTNDSRLVDEFWRRVNPVIVKVVKHACSRGCYGLAMDDDALSEGHLVAWNAVKTYDSSKGASLKTYIWSKVLFRFKDLNRKETLRAGREPLLSTYEKFSDDDETYSTDYVEADFDMERYVDEEREREMGAACCSVYSATSNRDRNCLDALMEAFATGERKPVEYAAERLHCSKQQVYNVRRRIRNSLPEDLVAEIVDCL